MRQHTFRPFLGQRRAKAGPFNELATSRIDAMRGDASNYVDSGREPWGEGAIFGPLEQGRGRIPPRYFQKTRCVTKPASRGYPRSPTRNARGLVNV